MFLIGVSWLVFWLLVDTFDVESLKAALATGLIFLVLGIFLDYRSGYWTNRP